MQQANPELVEQLRNQMRQDGETGIVLNSFLVSNELDTLSCKSFKQTHWNLPWATQCLGRPPCHRDHQMLPRTNLVHNKTI